MDKKELKETYKNTKPEMGVYAYKCKPTCKAYLGYGQNLKADINGVTFQLKLGSFYSSAKSDLQKDWTMYGESNFEISVLETSDYGKDESKIDYMPDLRVLREVCSEKFQQLEFIQK